MLLRRLFCFTFFAGITISSFAQLKVHSNGTVSIGTTTSSGYALTVDGYTAIKITYGGSYMRFSSSTANGVISSTSDKVAFWDSPNDYHTLVASAYTIGSDSILKTDISPLGNGLDMVMQLKPKTYHYKSDLVSDNSPRLYYGFLAQDMQQVLPDLVDSCMGSLAINYDGIIPLLVESVQIQQTVIDSLNGRITDLEDALYDGGIGTKSAQGTTNAQGELIELGQNNPNPFKESTYIPYSIPTSSSSAQIIVYDLRGEQLRSYEITSFGDGQLLIEGNTFKAGMYIYALIVDGQFIDSKKMILSK